MSPAHGIRLGVSLYSFTNEFFARSHDLKDLIAETGRLGLGPGLEAVGFQSFRSFPDVTDAEAGQFRDAVQAAGLTATCLGITADRFLRPGQAVSDEELVAFHARQMRSARRLGFSLVRFQHAATPAVIRALVPLAESLDMRMGLEVHAPLFLDHPVIEGYREMFEQVKSPLLGFIPDFGAAARAVPQVQIAHFREDLGAPQAVLDCATELWHDDALTPPDRMAAFADWCADAGIDPQLVSDISLIFGIIGRGNPARWSEIMPQVLHLHAKFYDCDPETQEDPAIDTAANLAPFIAAGWQGDLSCEWEGHITSHGSGFEMVAAQQGYLRRLLDPDTTLAQDGRT
ncbi:sugar phosphate isomerase/epimerase family protein [Mesobacterium pallidum]|uniref:sugar phosphate isomerase/epimerase family protein n=1 Tax=Mesobacterium pallidum TaxID=2872037 RepID=UPI001EE203AF|nr:sugar phosphate isomerase/epimerase [Mesobacterium pallidum]